MMFQTWHDARPLGELRDIIDGKRERLRRHIPLDSSGPQG